jgi:hypothetical protein
MGAVSQYSLGLGSIFTIISLPPAVFLMLGYATNPGLAWQALIVVVAGLGAVAARNRLDLLFPIKITPRVTNPWAQIAVMVLTYALVNLSSRLVIAGQLASISSYGTTSQLEILFQVSIMETLLVQFFLFIMFFAPLYQTSGNYWTSGAVAALASGFWGYIFHYYVYAAVAPVWNWVLVAFVILSVGYWLTGNILVPMIPHLLVDTLGLSIAFFLPSLCPGLGGLC